jgi:hypothetical protein
MYWVSVIRLNNNRKTQELTQGKEYPKTTSKKTNIEREKGQEIKTTPTSSSLRNDKPLK